MPLQAEEDPSTKCLEKEGSITMAASDSQSTGTGQAPAFDKTNQTTPLSVDDVKNIITQAQAGATDHVTVGMQIFNNLGDNIAVTGDTLRQALTDSGVGVDGPLSALVAAAANITKTGSQVAVTSTREIQTQISGTSIKFDPLVTFNVGLGEGFPTISNIQGAAAKKLFWFSITGIQLRENQGQKILHVDTSGGSRDFPVP
jgi:hypothetical protein